MKKTENVITFPKEKLNSPPQTLDEISEKIEKYKIDFAEEFSEILADMVLGELYKVGVDFSNIDENEFVPSIKLLLGSIRSLHLKGNNIHYYLQDVAEDLYPVDDSLVDKFED